MNTKVYNYYYYCKKLLEENDVAIVKKIYLKEGNYSRSQGIRYQKESRIDGFFK